MNTSFANLCICSTLVIATSAFAQETQATTQEAADAADAAAADPKVLVEQARAEVAKEIHSLPVLEPRPLKDVIKLAVEENELVVRTSLPTSSSRSIIRIPDLPGFTVVNVQRHAGESDEEVPKVLDFQHYTFGQPPNTIAVHTTIFASNLGHLNISRTVRGLEEDSIVQYVQQMRPPFGVITPGEDACRLYVQVLDEESEGDKLKLTLGAADIRDLRRRYPQETGIYLQPILRDLGQDAAVFAVDAQLAWQVFAHAIKPNAQLVEQIRALVAEFDADDFERREAAMEKLKQLGQPAAIALMQMKRGELSDEQNSGIDTFLAAYRPLPQEEAEKLRTSPGFLLDCLISEDASIREVAKAELETLLDRKIEFDVNASPAERSAAVAKLRTELLPDPTTQPFRS